MYDDIFLKQQIALKDFYNKVGSLVVVDKNAFLLSKLLKDFINVCSYHVEVPFDNTRPLRRKLMFTEDQIGFFKIRLGSSDQIIVYSQETNPCEFSAATLKGTGLRNKDLRQECGRRLKYVTNSCSPDTEWPLSADDLINTLDLGPNCDLYNLIYTSMYGTCTLNEYGYAKTENKNVSLKISAVASDWESLVTADQKK